MPPAGISRGLGGEDGLSGVWSRLVRSQIGHVRICCVRIGQLLISLDRDWLGQRLVRPEMGYVRIG